MSVLSHLTIFTGDARLGSLIISRLVSNHFNWAIDTTISFFEEKCTHRLVIKKKVCDGATVLINVNDNEVNLTLLQDDNLIDRVTYMGFFNNFK